MSAKQIQSEPEDPGSATPEPGPEDVGQPPCPTCAAKLDRLHDEFVALRNGTLKTSGCTQIVLRKSPESGQWYVHECDGANRHVGIKHESAAECARLADANVYEPRKFS